MSIEITHTTVKNVLTRTSGYLKTVSSHSLQPYRGCSYGNSLCGVGCYVQHNQYVLRGRRWGSFLEVRDNAAEAYRESFHREAAWARTNRERFSIFCSSATDPFVPQEKKFHITQRVLEQMLAIPPDELILQTHSHLVLEALPVLNELKHRCRFRVHVSIESDRETLPGLPPPASRLEQRMAACAELKQAGVFVVVTVSPLLPIENPPRFFQRIAEVADAVVIDHFIGGDGSSTGSRTLKTDLPAAMFAICAESTELDYRDRMVAEAQRHLSGRVGVGIDGFAGRYLP